MTSKEGWVSVARAHAQYPALSKDHIRRLLRNGTLSKLHLGPRSTRVNLRELASSLERAFIPAVHGRDIRDWNRAAAADQE
jgi:hypothetical protein